MYGNWSFYPPTVKFFVLNSALGDGAVPESLTYSVDINFSLFIHVLLLYQLAITVVVVVVVVLMILKYNMSFVPFTSHSKVTIER